MWKTNALRAVGALSFGAAVLLLTALPGAASADSPEQVAPSQAADAPLQVLEAHALYHWQARPSMRIPIGAAFTVHVPHGTTDADLYARVVTCQHQQPAAYPFCVAGSQIAVHRSGASYVIEVTSSARPLALSIQQRVSNLPHRARRA